MNKMKLKTNKKRLNMKLRLNINFFHMVIGCIGNNKVDVLDKKN